MSQPPPPPPHGEAPKSSGLPPGKYDIFIIPPHSSGSGFLYLPSLQPNINSFAAGFACALVLVAMFQSMAPAFQAWWNSFQGMGNMGITMLVVAVGVGAWAMGRSQQEGGPGQGGNSGPGSGAGGGASPGGTFSSSGSTGPSPGPSPNGGPPPHGAAPSPGPQPGPPPPHGAERPKPSWQRPQPPPPQPGTSRAETPKGAWEKAREETRKKEEERKAREEEQRRKDDAARRLKELREREAREREQREKEAKERDAREKEVKERREREAKELRERLEREAREKAEREIKEREEKRRKDREEAERLSRKGSTYAYSGVGERTNPWPNGKPPPATASPSQPQHAPSPSPHPPHASYPAPPPSSSSPNKKPPAPTARTYLGTDEDNYSYRPYDRPTSQQHPRRPTHKKSASSMSEASWAPSQSTARTTPPPSMRAPYSTKDPDKIVIKAVYGFLNAFAKTPASQLLSGIGSVTDGLILRITTEGLFIDDDVRGVPQREWDVKAWTLKLVEVWCPVHGCSPSSSAPTPQQKEKQNVLHKNASQRDRGKPASYTGDDADAWLTELLRSCKDCCRLGGDAQNPADGTNKSNNSQMGDWKARGLHLLRATIRDQEGKRYLFVLSQEESWKVAVGLQRLRRGTQVRALGVGGMAAGDVKTALETLGW